LDTKWQSFAQGDLKPLACVTPVANRDVNLSTYKAPKSSCSKPNTIRDHIYCQYMGITIGATTSLSESDRDLQEPISGIQADSLKSIQKDPEC